jgi:putative transcriptional regulator
MNAKNLKGKLLISAPILSDIFKRSVILITEHNENGSIGFIINKPTEYFFHEVIKDFPVFQSKVLIGGPVDPQSVNFIHKENDISDSYEIKKGIYWNGNYEELKILAGSDSLNPEDFRFFLGYSGWSPGQLENELKLNSWYVADVNEEIIFANDEKKMWREILKNMGGEYKIISTFPDDPSVN